MTVLGVAALCTIEAVLIVLLLLESNRRRRANSELRRRIAEAELAEGALRQSEARYRAVVEDQTELICRFLPDGTFTFVNDAYCRYFERSSEDLLAQTFWQFIPPEGHPAAREFLASITPAHSVASREHEVVSPSGEIRWQQWRDRGFFDEHGKIVEYQAVGRDVTERRRAEEGLRQFEAQKQVEAALRETDRRKDEFLAMLAHELRNPLAPITTAVEIMRRIELADADLRIARDVVGRQVAQLTRLVDDLLDVSRITRGTINVELEPLDLCRVVRQAVETSGPVISAGRHELSIEIPPYALNVRGDVVRLTQVVANLLNNAAKHSGDNTSIRIRVWRDGSEAVLSVKDSGIGIPDGMQDRIFEPFTQLAAPDRRRDGLGVGLTLVKRLVEIHQGSVEAHSAGTGRGSEFFVRLPALSAATSQDDPDVLQVRRDSGIRRIAGASRRRILVVDDNADAADLLGRMLELEAHQVEVVHDGPSALLAAERSPPDVVLLDLGLPEMDGIEVAQRLRERSKQFRPLLVAVSGYAQQDDLRRTAEAGFDYHLVKPVDLEALQAVLERAPRR